MKSFSHEEKYTVAESTINPTSLQPVAIWSLRHKIKCFNKLIPALKEKLKVLLENIIRKEREIQNFLSIS